MKNYTSAVIVAAGNSTRMGLSVPKHFLPLEDNLAIEYTLSTFQFCSIIDEVIVVCRKADFDQMSEICSAFTKVKKVVLGGDNRTESVKNGVNATSENTKFVAIHDGARILVTDEEIKDVVRRAYACKAATLGTHVTDTIKTVAKNMTVVDTPDRSRLFAVQTPQVFEKSLYLRALKNTLDNSLSVTDDCSMVELLGEKVEVVLGKSTNIKLTTQSDITLALAILSKRKMGLL